MYKCARCDYEFFEPEVGYVELLHTEVEGNRYESKRVECCPNCGYWDIGDE